ncbi:hypothetical protein ABW19_dt0203162 [Dactylella cylindrospora]|nr:hypothetical protein ABW19_dt0203162 [Dactylella cylindrospora]
MRFHSVALLSSIPLLAQSFEVRFESASPDNSWGRRWTRSTRSSTICRNIPEASKLSPLDVTYRSTDDDGSDPVYIGVYGADRPCEEGIPTFAVKFANLPGMLQNFSPSINAEKELYDQGFTVVAEYNAWSVIQPDTPMMKIINLMGLDDGDVIWTVADDEWTAARGEVILTPDQGESHQMEEEEETPHGSPFDEISEEMFARSRLKSLKKNRRLVSLTKGEGADSNWELIYPEGQADEILMSRPASDSFRGLLNIHGTDSKATSINGEPLNRDTGTSGSTSREDLSSINRPLLTTVNQRVIQPPSNIAFFEGEDDAGPTEQQLRAMQRMQLRPQGYRDWLRSQPW